MAYEPEIIISPHKEVFQNIAQVETKVVCWDATADAEYQEMYGLVQEFKRTSFQSNTEDVLGAVEEYAQSIIDTDIHPVVNPMERFAGYQPLDTWIVESGGFENSDSIPHRDYPCIGVFFYFNEEAELNTSCIPDAYSGEPTDSTLSYKNADKTESVSFPAQSVAIAKLHQTTHFAPNIIPEGVIRVVMNARYDY